MSHAERCPVCFGSGKVLDKTCHGCGGRGWVEVGDFQPARIHPPIIHSQVVPLTQPDVTPSPWPQSLPQITCTAGLDGGRMDTGEREGGGHGK